MDAVNEALQLLRGRRQEAWEQANALNTEVAQIDAAIKALTTTVVIAARPAVAIAAVPVPNVEAPPRTRAGGLTMKEHVRKIIRSEPRPWSLDELADAIRADGGQGDRDEKQFRGTMRTALWTLRKEGAVKRVGHKMNIATEFADLDDTLSTNAEATVGAVASDNPAPTSERSDLEDAQTSSSVQTDDLDHARMGTAVVAT